MERKTGKINAKIPGNKKGEVIMMTPLEWMMSGDTGISSQTIMCVMTGTKNRGHFGADIPYDPSDFGRCYRLLKHFPQWRSRMQQVADKYPAWQPLVDNWDELTALYEKEIKNKSGRAPKLYEMMRKLRGR